MAAGVILPAAYGSASLIAQPGQEARTLGRVIAGWSVSLVAGVPLSALISDAIGWRATYGVLALCAAVALLACAACPNAAPPIPRRCACRACWRRCRTATCRRCCWAAWHSRPPSTASTPSWPTTCAAGAVGRTGRFHRLRLRRRLHAVGPAGRAADRTPGPAPRATAGAGRRRSGLPGAAARRAGAAGRAAHRRRLGRGLAAVPEPAGAAAVARPPRGTRRWA